MKRTSRNAYKGRALATVLILAVLLPLLGQSGGGPGCPVRPGSGGSGGLGGSGGSGGLGCPGPVLALFVKEVCATYPVGLTESMVNTLNPFVIGESYVQNQLSTDLQIQFVSDSPKILFFPSTATLSPGQRLRFRVAAIALLLASDATIPFRVSGTVLNKDGSKQEYDDVESFVGVDLRAFDDLMYPCDLYEDIQAVEKGGLDDKLDCITGTPLGKLRFNSNPTLAQLIAAAVIENIFLFEKRMPLTFTQLRATYQTPLPAKGEEPIPCGEIGPHGLVICPDNMDTMAEGDYFIISQVLDDLVPLTDTVNFYQYGFVFDSDNDPADNWVALPVFANDYFQGTDRWYVVDYDPNRTKGTNPGWVLNVSQIVVGSPPQDGANHQITADSSGAFALINGNAITLIVPASEFPEENPAMRITSFRHAGDFGQNPPFNWSGDYWPDFDEPLDTAAAF